MTREERCKLAIEKGYTYDAETGLVKNRHGKVLKTTDNRGYNRLFIFNDKKRYDILSHQFGWYYIHGYCAKEIDHINGVRDDNRLCNLRSVTHQQNNWNMTKAKGYYYHKTSKKYLAQISSDYKIIHLGLYNTPEEARAAYLQAKEKYHKI
jgi:hypothetical protein